MTFKPYDPTWLINLAKDQLSYEKWLPAALSSCTQCHEESDPYPHLYFFDPLNPGADCPKWQSDFVNPLTFSEQGQIYFDVLRNGDIVGIAILADKAMETKYQNEKWEVDRERREAEYRAMIFEPYDPTWLVNLAKEQFPETKWLETALCECIRYNKNDPAYYYFINPLTQVVPALEQPEIYCFCLKSPERGEIIVDVGKDGKVHGIELIYELTGEKDFLERCEKNPIIVD